MTNKYLEKIARFDTLGKTLLRPPVRPGLAAEIAAKKLTNQVAGVRAMKGPAMPSMK